MRFAARSAMTSTGVVRRAILEKRLTATPVDGPAEYYIDVADLRAFVRDFIDRDEQRRKDYDRLFVQHVARKYGPAEATRLELYFEERRRRIAEAAL